MYVKYLEDEEMGKETDNQDTSQADSITETEMRAKKPFSKPKLAFIEPKLAKHGDATKVTQQQPPFFGGFSI